MAIQVGCGSWSDAKYVRLLYPPGLPAGQRLAGYAHWFGHVEVNASFYNVTDRAAAARWEAMTPPGFLFDFKLHKTLSRHATGWGNLPPALRPRGNAATGPMEMNAALQAEIVAYTLEQLEPLVRAGKLGAFLLLPAPRFTPDRHRLEEFDPIIAALKGRPLAVELRQRAWIEGKTKARTLGWFRERGVTWVAVDMPRADAPNIVPPLDEVTQPKLAYLRLHGRNTEGYLHGKTADERFHYDYNARELREIVARIRHLAGSAADVRVVASNHAEDFAPKAALELKRLLGERLPEPPGKSRNLL